MNFRRAHKIAKKSTHRCHKHVAFIMSGRRILMTGYNHGDVHAEADVLRKMRWEYHNHDVARGYDLVSIRITRSNRFGISRPCRDCMRDIIEAGIRRIIYTDKNGLLVKEKP